MKKDIAKKWIRALRSGKYKQGKTYLKQVDDNRQAKYCCLGVLCELYNDTTKKNHKKTLSTQININSKTSTDFFTFNGKAGELPSVVMEWAGINSCLGDLGQTEHSLACLNDFGSTFESIANIIEKNVENL